MTYTAEDFSRIVDRLFMNVWKRNDMGEIAHVFHPDCRVHGLVPGESLNRDEYREAVEQYQQLARLHRYELLDVLFDGGDRAAVRLCLHLTATVAGITAPQDAMMFIRLKDRQVIEAHVQFDTLKYFELIGALPANSSFLLLAGHALT